MTHIDAQVGMIPISRVRTGRDEIERRHFSAREIEALATRGPRTVAGFLAAKSALLELCRTVAGRDRVERDFELAHDEDGAPRIVSITGGPGKADHVLLARLRVSISHSGEYAFGLAVHERARGMPRTGSLTP